MQMQNITKRQDKVNNTIAKIVARLEKFKAMSLEQYAKKHKMSMDDVEHVKYWYGCDLRSIEEQLANNIKKLEEAKRLDQKESDRLNKEAIKIFETKKLLDSLPEVLKNFLADSIEYMYSDMLKKKEYVDKKYEMYIEKCCELDKNYWNWSKELKEAKKGEIRELRLNPQEYSLHSTTVERIRKDCVESCEASVVDLVNRVYYKIGDIADCSGLHYCHGEINGVIRSKDGETVTVNSILAGGYNIQCLHIRTLVR